jgi:PAS domain S-box-containing protein
MQKIWLPSLRKAEALQVAEAQQPENQRFESELQSLYRYLRKGLCFLDTDLRFVRVNEHLAKLNGLPAKEHLGRGLQEVVPDLAEPVGSICREVLKTGIPSEGVLIHGNTPAWSDRDFLASYYPVRGANGNMTGVSILVEDITERRQADNAQRWLAAIVESSADAIISKDLNGIITSWNAGAERVFGYKPEEVIGKPITILMPPERQEEEPRILERVRTGERVEHFETVRVTKDGRQVEVSLTISPVRNAEGKILGVSKIARDISERRQTERFVQHANERLSHYAEDLEKQVAERTTRLEQTIQSLAGVCYHIAHDLRAPIRAIRGFTELLLESHGFVLNAQGKEFVRRIVSACSRMDLLIQDLLAYGRLSHTDLPSGWISLEDSIELVLEQYADEIKKKKGLVQVIHPLPQIWANPTVLEQSLSNLLSNALKYVAEDISPQVKLWAEEGEKTVRLIVQDNGIGVARAHHERVFKIFERLHPDSDYPGTGIGLAIVQKGMERMGGRVLLDSDTGTGSKFILEFPKPEQPLGK